MCVSRQGIMEQLPAACNGQGFMEGRLKALKGRYKIAQGVSPGYRS